MKGEAKAIEHIRFCIELFKLQRHRGAYFLMEHPAYADSWGLLEMVELASLEGVNTSVADQCMYGLLTQGASRDEQAPARIPTK